MDELFNAAKFDDSATLTRLVVFPYSSTIHMGAISKSLFEKVDWQLQSNPSLLSVACFYGSTRCVNVLLAMGADVNDPDENGVPFLLSDFLSISPRSRETLQFS